MNNMKMRHSVTGVETVATRQAFDNIWSKRGWVEVEVIGPGFTLPEGGLDDMKVPALKKLAAGLGIVPIPKRKQDIIDQIRAGQSPT